MMGLGGCDGVEFSDPASHVEGPPARNNFTVFVCTKSSHD